MDSYVFDRRDHPALRKKTNLLIRLTRSERCDSHYGPKNVSSRLCYQILESLKTAKALHQGINAHLGEDISIGSPRARTDKRLPKVVAQSPYKFMGAHWWK